MANVNRKFSELTELTQPRPTDELLVRDVDQSGDDQFKRMDLSRVTTSAYDVRNYGATGDGVTNDTTALQAAIDASEWGTLFIPPGVYCHTGLTLDPTKGYRIIGAGYDPSMVNCTVLKNTGTGHAITIDNTAGTNNNNLIEIEHLGLYGAQTSGDAIRAVKVSGLRLYKIAINTHGGYGVYLDTCYGSKIFDCYCNNNGKSGIYLGNSNHNVSIRGGQVSGNSRANGYANIEIAGTCAIVTIDDVDMSSAGAFPWSGTISDAWGFKAINVSGLNVTNCYFELNKLGAIYLNGSTISGFRVVGNYITDGHIWIYGSALNGEISNNYFSVTGNSSKNVTNAVDNGSGAIRLTVVGHGLESDMLVNVASVGGVTNANGGQVVTRIDADTIDLLSSTFAGAYTSGGTVIQAAGLRMSPAAAIRSQIRLSGNDLSQSNVVQFYLSGGFVADRTHYYGTAAPGSGTWVLGDIVWNTSPSAAGAPGWVCTAAGTPGTWKAMANLAA